MAGNKTSISSGIIVGKILMEDPEVSSMVTKVFPVVVDEATLPYVAYRCVATEVTDTKCSGSPDTAVIEVGCFAATYGESVRLAESVRAALDMKTAEADGIRMRKSQFSGRKEGSEGDAYVQNLVFRVDIR